MFKSFKYRIYPTEAQKQLLSKHFGATRFVYNLALETKISAYNGSKVNLSRYDLQKELPLLKRELSWLKEVNSQSLQYSLLQLDSAFDNFYKGKGFPKFKRKAGEKSFTCPQGVSIENNSVKIPKFKSIKIKLSRPIEGVISKATISQTSTGKYFISLCCDLGIEQPNKLPVFNSVGIDFGVKRFLTLSDGITFENNSYLKSSIDRLKVLQRRASKKAKGSSNRKKSNLKISLLHERIKNQRLDYLHKVSTSITKKYDTICLEDLNIAGMVKNHNLSQSIIDTAWNTFETILKYKCDFKGNNFIYVSRFYPSSKTCSNCGILKNMTLSERMYNCECGLSIDRDLNAAINIRNSGMGNPVVPVELPAIVGTMKQEFINTKVS